MPDVAAGSGQGKAFKTLVAMPFVLDGKRGQVEVTPWDAASDRVLGRPDPTGASDLPRVDPRRKCKKQHFDDDPVAGFSLLLEDSNDQFLQFAATCSHRYLPPLT